MDNQKCLVCGYTFSKEDFNALETVYECPYCHTKKKIYSDNDDFLRKNLLTEGYDHLSKSEIVEASRKFSTFRSQYENYIDDELNWVKRWQNANCRIVLIFRRTK